MKYCSKTRLVVMFGTISVVLILTCIIYSSGTESPHQSLKIIHVVFRHGDRTPTETYPNDPYINYEWPDGWGALTKKGKQQLFNLGKTLHKQYKILTDDLTPSQIYVKSSDADRCHMSAATLLAGMFPPTEKQIWNPDLNWQPIPIHSLPRDLDNVVAMKKKCPTYDQALKDAYSSPEIQKINEKNAELYKYLTEKTGKAMTNITDVEFLFNTLEIEDMNGLELPDWTKDIYPDKLKTLAARSLSIFTETLFMRRMKGGVMLSEMINNVNKLKIGAKLKRKIFLYSAHDISLANLLRTIGFVEDFKPEYGAAFVLEVHSNQPDVFNIKMQYFNSSESVKPYSLQLDSCREPCTFEKFVQVTKDVVPVDWNEECNHPRNLNI